MTLTHVTAIRNTLADAVVDAVDVGTTDVGGDILIQDGAGVTLVAIPLANPAFGDAANGTASVSGVPVEGTAVAAGTAARFLLRNRNNAEVLRGTVTVTAGGGDMQLSSVSIAINDVIRLNTITYNAPQ
jgi:hypothetical protein